ncbi:diversity-generating retroelement protein Avd [Alcaligenaceae bacterium]|nr:diversity-generating retroelement protein Avd [Alcaligenaceae bacterium]
MKDPHLTLMTKLEELDTYTHKVLHQFPRLERHLLCAEMRASMTCILRQTVIAWKRRQKTAALFDLDIEIAIFRSLIRKAHRLGYIKTRRLGIWMRHTNEIGNIVGGWIKHEAEKSPKGGAAMR